RRLSRRRPRRLRPGRSPGRCRNGSHRAPPPRRATVESLGGCRPLPPMILLMFGVMFLLIALELPIAFALICAAFFYLHTGTQIPPSIVVQRMSTGIDSFPLLAIPLFVLAGNLLNSGGIARRLFDFSIALIGHLRGGLAQVNILASMIFSGMSGVAQADAAGLGTVEIKAMRSVGFDAAFSAAVSASSAIIGPIIPPSIIMVIYGVLAQVSVGDLFLAGILPGIVSGLRLMLTVYVLVNTGRGHETGTVHGA